jgi:hypothetical protein
LLKYHEFDYRFSSGPATPHLRRVKSKYPMNPRRNLQVTSRPYGLKAITLSLLILGAGVSLPANAAVVAVTGETHDSNYNLTSVTIGGTLYSDLTGATATSVGGALVYYLTGTTPTITNTATDRNTSLTGLSYREGAGNVLIDSTFQFGRVITASDYIFISDLGAGTDSVSFNLIDSLGGVVGDYTISLTSLGGVSLIASTAYTGTPAAVGSQAQTFGAFRLSDF